MPAPEEAAINQRRCLAVAVQFIALRRLVPIDPFEQRIESVADASV
jgi:hypothetical protein